MSNDNTPMFSEMDLLASITRESFFEFVKEFWDTVIAEPYVGNWHIEYLCGRLQHIADRVFKGKDKEKDLIINISPGSTKSTIASIMFPAWVWANMPSAGFIGGSYAHALAMDLSRKNRSIITSDKYQACFGTLYDKKKRKKVDWVKLKDDQNTKHHFVNTRKGARIAVGVGGAITGMHADFIVVDDPINPNEALSEIELHNANRWMSETLPTRKKNKAKTPTILIMQRLHQNDCTKDMIDRLGENAVEHICLPAEITKNIKPVYLEDFYIDGLMDIKRLPKKVLEENRRTLGEYGYAGQFLQNPVPLGGGMFKTERIQIDAPSLKWVKRVRYWDKAATQDGGAYTAGVLIGKDIKGCFWILDVVRGRWGSDKREAIIKQTAMLDGTDVEIGVEQEPGSGGKDSALSTVKNLAGWRVFIERPTGDKALRADPFSVQVNNGNVWMQPGNWNKEYIEEMTYFPFSTYKDQVDATSGAFNRIANGKLAIGVF